MALQFVADGDVIGVASQLFVSTKSRPIVKRRPALVNVAVAESIGADVYGPRHFEESSAVNVTGTSEPSLDSGPLEVLMTCVN